MTIYLISHFPESKSPKKSTSEVPKKIGVVHINKVLSEVYGSGAAASQQETIPLQQKLVMCSLLLLLKQGKMKEVTVGKVCLIALKIGLFVFVFCCCFFVSKNDPL